MNAWRCVDVCIRGKGGRWTLERKMQGSSATRARSVAVEQPANREASIATYQTRSLFGLSPPFLCFPLSLSLSLSHHSLITLSSLSHPPPTPAGFGRGLMMPSDGL